MLGVLQNFTGFFACKVINWGAQIKSTNYFLETLKWPR